MATAQIGAERPVDDLMAAVKHLSPSQLRELTRRLAEWRKQHKGVEREEAALLTRIAENSRLPPAEQRRFDRLRRKRQAETLTKAEETELQALWQSVERMNVTRLEALRRLAERRGTDLRTLMRELGLAEKRDVF